MPSNEDFTLEILVGGQVLPEYEKDGQVYVESNLCTPVSYKKHVQHFVGTELESQQVPVTPYQIRIRAQDQAPRFFYKIFVDGVKVKSTTIQSGQERLIRGFKDGAHIREFLFSLPRFSKDEEDRIEGERHPYIGKVEVECWIASLRRSIMKHRKTALGFDQATKKDCFSVTKGNYTMATSSVGNTVCRRTPFRNVDHWQRVNLKSKLSVQYHMGHTLLEMGFTLRPVCTGPLNSVASPLKNHRSPRLKRPHPSSATSTNGVLDGVKNEGTNEVKEEPIWVPVPSTKRRNVRATVSAVRLFNTNCSQLPIVDLTDDSEDTFEEKPSQADSGVGLTPVN